MDPPRTTSRPRRLTSPVPDHRGTFRQIYQLRTRSLREVIRPNWREHRIHHILPRHFSSPLSEHHSPLPPFQFLCSTWNPVSSPRPTHVLRPTCTGPVKVGRRSALAARSVVSRPRLDRREHGGDAGCSRDDDQRGALPSGADHRATTLYSVGP